MAVIEGCEVDWAAIPGMFGLDPSIAYLNHGGYGAVPLAVQRAQQRLRDEMELNPTRFFGVELLTRLGHCRAHVARFLGTDPAGLSFVANATAGTAVVLNTIAERLRPGLSILTTNHGYGAVDIAVAQLCARTGATAQRVDIPVGASQARVLDAFRAKLNGRFALAIVDQITSPTAQATPIKAIVALLKGEGIPVLVDGAHAPGQIAVDLDDLGADFWVGNLHKWAFAVRGTAALAVAPPWRAAIRPLVDSWHGPDGFPTAVESVGTTDYTAWLAAPAALYLLRTLDPLRVRQHNIELARYGQRVVASALHDAGLGPTPDELPSSGADELSMRLVPVPRPAIDRYGSTGDAAAALGSKLGVWMAVTGHGDQRYLRLSAQIYNTRADYDRLAGALPAVLAG